MVYHSPQPNIHSANVPWYVACCPLGVTLKPFKYILRIKQSLFCVERVLSVNSEQLIMQMADRLAEDGYRDAGYTYVSIDVSSASGLQK